MTDYGAVSKILDRASTYINKGYFFLAKGQLKLLRGAIPQDDQSLEAQKLRERHGTLAVFWQLYSIVDIDNGWTRDLGTEIEESRIVMHHDIAGGDDGTKLALHMANHNDGTGVAILWLETQQNRDMDNIVVAQADLKLEPNEDPRPVGCTAIAQQLEAILVRVRKAGEK